jgi:hypothetical protein
MTVVLRFPWKVNHWLCRFMEIDGSFWAHLSTSQNNENAKSLGTIIWIWINTY